MQSGTRTSSTWWSTGKQMLPYLLVQGETVVVKSSLPSVASRTRRNGWWWPPSHMHSISFRQLRIIYMFTHSTTTHITLWTVGQDCRQQTAVEGMCNAMVTKQLWECSGSFQESSGFRHVRKRGQRVGGRVTPGALYGIQDRVAAKIMFEA